MIDVSLVSSVKLPKNPPPQKRKNYTFSSTIFWACFTIKLGKNDFFGQNAGGKSV